MSLLRTTALPETEVPAATTAAVSATTVIDSAPAKETLVATDLDILSIIERVGSVFSLLGCLFIIGTFCSSKVFHKPINRLVFYASFGNMMTNVGTLMARTYVDSPSSVGCQFQAFLIQMFMPADAFWTLAMAINVYLTFYQKFDAQRLRKMEIPYLIFCYGVPLIPAFVYIFIQNSEGQRVYGNATLWCWVTPQWDIWRIATFYGPVWVVILITFFIYIRAGRTIYEKRKQLHNFSTTTVPEPEDPYSVKTTEVSVTTEILEGPPSLNNASVPRRGSEAGQNGGPNTGSQAYSVTISSDKRLTVVDPNEVGTGPNTISSPPNATTQRMNRRRNYELNNAAWSYTKCAILFFTAILVTWIPSSANRVYSVIHTNETSAPLEYMSALVLPLQGFWNAIIYVTTSWKACQTYFSEFSFRAQPKVKEIVGRRPQYFGRRDLNKSYESESMTELQSTRPNSNDRKPSV